MHEVVEFENKRVEGQDFWKFIIILEKIMEYT